MNQKSFTKTFCYYTGLASVGLIIGGVLVLPICPPVGVMMIMVGAVFLLALPMTFTD